MEIPQRNIAYGHNQNEAIVRGFDVPESPDSSYDNVYDYPVNDEKDTPPIVPQHLHNTLLSSPADGGLPESLPSPQTLNHLYRENRKTEGPVVAVGLTHRFRAKYVTVVLYKPAQAK
ncbi:AMPKBI domain-containing protein [Heracleum sosnowskyi]|uniref:AMPKBI domain-containing protein n=1 Tax=Heracleum sosnowskyi TaxID=360622 RepID=A0AAD8H0S2_9APIA|nr:AMPKBI domain-containing protein [Heracleum sosnowskyi]